MKAAPETVEVTGGCLCGAVRFEATVQPGFSACYCKMCQRWSSGTFMGLSTERFAITEGEDALQTYRSSEWAERGFCKQCGSNLFYHALQRPCPSVAMGAVDETDALSVAMEFFTDKRPGDLRLANTTHAMTEAETIRYFGADQED